MIDAAIKECLLYRRQPWGKLAIIALIVLSMVAAGIVLTAYIEMDSFELQGLRAFAYQIHERMVQKPILFVLFVVTGIVIFIYSESDSHPVEIALDTRCLGHSIPIPAIELAYKVLSDIGFSSPTPSADLSATAG